VRPMEWLAWAPLLAFILILGVYPKLVLEVTNGAVAGLTKLFG